jgi:hypothetical protein
MSTLFATDLDALLQPLFEQLNRLLPRRDVTLCLLLKRVQQHEHPIGESNRTPNGTCSAVISDHLT